LPLEPGWAKLPPQRLGQETPGYAELDELFLGPDERAGALHVQDAADKLRRPASRAVELIEELGMEQRGAPSIGYGVMHRKDGVENHQTILGREGWGDDGQLPWRPALYLGPGAIVLVFENANQGRVLSVGIPARPLQELDMVLEVDGRTLDELWAGGVLASNAYSQ
jgi:hypothetical protein